MTEVIKDGFKFNAKDGKSFYFIGVTTSKSSIMKIFPLWMQELGFKDIKIYPCDLKIHDEPQNYRAVVARIKYDDGCYGGLVTTHKMDLYSAAKDMFSYFDPYALLLGEISCISKKMEGSKGMQRTRFLQGLRMTIFKKGLLWRHRRTYPYIRCRGLINSYHPASYK